MGDLGHILERSHQGATIHLAALPRSDALATRLTGAERALALQALLGGGDDYELCFTAAPAQRDALAALGREIALPLTRVGSIETKSGLRIRDEGGEPLQFAGRSYDHFGSRP